jgi:hypothetical protein
MVVKDKSKIATAGSARYWACNRYSASAMNTNFSITITHILQIIQATESRERAIS